MLVSPRSSHLTHLSMLTSPRSSQLTTLTSLTAPHSLTSPCSSHLTHLTMLISPCSSHLAHPTSLISPHSPPCDYSQISTEPNVNLIQRAQQHGWTTDENCRNRIKSKVNVFLKRTAHCFSALTEEEMSEYLKGHADVCRLSPIMKNRDKTVQRLIELRLPAPELSTHSSKALCGMLYGLMST